MACEIIIIRSLSFPGSTRNDPQYENTHQLFTEPSSASGKDDKYENVELQSVRGKKSIDMTANAAYGITRRWLSCYQWIVAIDNYCTAEMLFDKQINTIFYSNKHMQCPF